MAVAVAAMVEAVLQAEDAELGRAREVVQVTPRARARAGDHQQIGWPSDHSRLLGFPLQWAPRRFPSTHRLVPVAQAPPCPLACRLARLI